MPTEPELETRIREIYAGLTPSPEVREELAAGLEGPRRPPARRLAGAAALLVPIAAAVLAIFLWGGRGGAPGAASSLEAEREANRKAYDRLRADLHAKSAGRFVVIAGGELAAIGDTVEEVADAAPDAAHRFVFRVGQDGDLPSGANFWYGPRFAGMQIVMDLGLDWRSSFSSPSITRGEQKAKVVGAPPFPGVIFTVAPPGGEAREMEVFLGTCGPPLMLTPTDWERLGLARFEVPGTMDLFGLPCRRGLVRAGLAGIDATTILVASCPAFDREKLLDLNRYRDSFWTWGGNLADKYVREGRRGKWVLFGANRVLGEGSTKEAAWRDGQGKTDFVYHRFLLRLPRGEPLVLPADTFEDSPEREMALNGRRVPVRGPEDGPLLVSPATARAIGLELAEEGRDVRLGDRAARAGYAWEGEMAARGARLRLVLVSP